MKTEEFDFNTDTRVMPSDPNELRGKTRDSGRMVVLDRGASKIEHTVFTNIVDYFRPGDLLVLNDSHVIANTLPFETEHGPTQVTVFGHEPDGTNIIRVVNKDVPTQPGLFLTAVDNKQLTCKVLEPTLKGLWKAKFSSSELLLSTLDRFGMRLEETIPTNPDFWKANQDAYRSVYSKKAGSLEIPSAGLHFSKDQLNEAVAKGVETAYITLHVGATEILAISHISAEEVENHKVKSEWYEVGEKAAAQINAAMTDGRRIIGVGTTVMRTLESLKTPVVAQEGWTDLYIYPGFNFRLINVLLTNLHRPRSSHIVLTAAFAGKELVMRSYDEILEDGGYEFDLYGDSMLIV